ncbi:MAG TPA: VCBS repeat-containing protein [Kofleriaceae bacterium]|jgi:hypothetical protein
MRASWIAFAFALGACSDAVTLTIAGDRPIPTGLDAICVGVAAPSGEGFGRDYRLEGALDHLPQTLRVEAGGADTAWAWVRGDRGGAPVARAAAAIDFSGDVTLALDACERGPAGTPAQRGDAVGPGAAHLAASQGAGGTLVVAIADGAAAIIDARDGALVADAAPAAPDGHVEGVIAADLDGDCDDDLVIATDAAPPEVWRRDGASFTDAGTLGTAVASAIAAADVDRDGDLDLVVGGGGALALFRNDGSGTYTRDAAALDGAGRVAAVSALALGDLDGDGNPDLVVGQTRTQAGDAQPLVAWLGEPGGTGSFNPADGAVPAVPLDVVALTLADADGDFDPDLAVAVNGAPLRLYIDRDGLLEDQSFVRLPQPAPIASAVAFGGWDDGCEPDAVIAAAAGSQLLRGTPTDAFAAEGAAPAATDVVLADIDDDGDLDAILATPDGVVWLAR